MVLDAKKLSAAIREKKKKMMSAEPELVDTDALIDVNPNDKMFADMDARAETTLGSSSRMDARNSAMEESDHDAETMGETSDEMKRMGRLKRMLDGMDL